MNGVSVHLKMYDFNKSFITSYLSQFFIIELKLLCLLTTLRDFSLLIKVEIKVECFYNLLEFILFTKPEIYRCVSF